jgi:mannan endo-1,4-beta-mannosidase
VFDALPVKPVIANYYSGWGESFKADFARAAAADGMETFVEMEPWNCGACGPGGFATMTDISAGKYDQYLTRFGAQIRAYGGPVLVTFAHEMNGRWYPWGRGGAEGVTPAQWIAGWDHVVTVVNGQAPGLVTWMWAPNAEGGAGPVAPYWPGRQYVGVAGIDGYLRSGADTYESVFGRTVADIRALTSAPIWIAETGVNIDATTGARLAAYVAAVRAARLQGLLYFNKSQYALPRDDLAVLAAAVNSPGR